jgi:hypothetical protein
MYKNNKQFLENKKYKHLLQLYLLPNQKKTIIHNLFEAFTVVDISLEKVNFLLEFFKIYCKEGGTIPQAATL